jgi:hypothetical protein
VLEGSFRAYRAGDDFGDASPRGHGKLHGPFLTIRGSSRPDLLDHLNDRQADPWIGDP